MRRVALTLAGIAAGSVLLAGCSGGHSVKAAPHAADPACGVLLAHLPTTVLGHARRSLDVAGTAEWGEPAIVLRCGVGVPGPTTTGCTNVNDDVDWVFAQTKKYYVFTSFGRSPATEVDVPVTIDRSAAPSALVDLNDAVNGTPKNSLKCQ